MYMSVLFTIEFNGVAITHKHIAYIICIYCIDIFAVSNCYIFHGPILNEYIINIYEMP